MKVDLQELKENVEKEMLQLERRRQTLEDQMGHIEAVQRMISGLEGVESAEATLLAGPADSQRKHWFRG